MANTDNGNGADTNTILLVIVIIALIAGGFYWYYNRQVATPNNTTIDLNIGGTVPSGSGAPAGPAE
jgi:LPXTG-motif cell wall-anchored protein